MFETICGHTILTSRLGPRPLVLDLGANRGQFATAVREGFDATVHLVEANPALVGLLENRGRFHVHHCAVAATSGEMALNVAVNDEGSSILQLPSTSVYGCVLDKILTVPARTLESLVADVGVSRVDLLKMDIEGAEVQVLGAVPERTLRSIAQITVEFHCDDVFGFGLREQVRGVIDRLRGLGFVHLEFSPTLRNVLFLNRPLLGISRAMGLLWEMRVNTPGWTGHLPVAVRQMGKKAIDWASGHGGRVR